LVKEKEHEQDAEAGSYPTGQKPKYGPFDIRRYSPTQESKEKRKSNVLFFVALFAIIMLAVYGWYWYNTPGGERQVVQLKNALAPYNPATWYMGKLSQAQDIGNVWSAGGGNETLKGVLFDSFKVAGSEEIPQGSPVVFAYGLKLANAVVSKLPLTLSCNIKDKDIAGDIIPSNPLIISGKRITQNARCRFNSEITKELSGTVEVEGGVIFPFSTTDAKLKVYFTSEEMEQSLLSADEGDFFSYLGIDEQLPLRTAYNGEPIELGIGVSTENEQPVVLREGYNPLIGITLNNRWDGKMLNLTEFRLIIPKELSINQEISQNPNGLCPFTLARQGKTTNEYRASEELIEQVSLEKGRLRSFECWLDVAPELLGSAQYTVKEYEAEADYVYQLPSRTATITVKGVAGKETGIGEDLLSPLV